MRKLIVILVLCAAASGCTTLSTPPQPPAVAPTDMTNYFWPQKDTSLNYSSAADNKHVVISMAGGMVMGITTTDLTTNATSTVFDTISAGSTSLSSLSSSTLLQFPDSAMVVSDTNALSGPMPLKITAIAASSGGWSGFTFVIDSVYVVTESGGLYVFDTASGSFRLRCKSIGSNSISTLLPSPILANPNLLFAFSKQDGKIFLSTDLGSDWRDISTGFVPSNITAVAEGQNLYAIAGSKIYKFDPSPSQMKWVGNYDAGEPLTCIVAASGGASPRLIIGTQSGNTIRMSGVPNFLLKDRIPVILGDSVSFVSANYGSFSNDNSVYALSNGNLFSMHDADDAGGWISIPSPLPNIASITSDQGDSYVESSDGKVAQLTIPSPKQLGNTLPSPATSVVSLPPNDYYALAGNQLFRDSSKTKPWMPVTPINGQATQRKAGTFTLLKDGQTSWQAGLAIRTVNGQQRGYSYQANFVEKTPVVLDSIPYSDVNIIDYIPSAAGVTDNIDMPQFRIYYQRGVGPVRIERTMNNSTVITTIAK